MEDNPMLGTTDPDKMYGYGAYDYMLGYGGNDLMDGGNDNDKILGGSGNDTILGGDGNDILNGEDGDDYLDGGDGDDVLNGDAGDDTLQGGDGNNVLNGNDGDDTLIGGPGMNQLSGGPGKDTLLGGDLFDSMSGDDGDDTLDAGAGNDLVYGVEGKDTLMAGDGDDVVSGADGDDSMYGGAGNDFMGGGSGHDTVQGDDGNDRVWGDDGDDTVDGGAGNDYVSGGWNPYTNPIDKIKDDGDDTVNGGAGNDVVHGGMGKDNVQGGAGNDDVFGDAGNDTLGGGDGNDVLAGGSGNDVVRGGAGGDILLGNDGIDDLDGESGDDIVLAGAGNDLVKGGVGKDVLFGESGADYLNGGPGNDILVGGNGVVSDTLYGGADSDLIFGGNGVDTLRGGTGNDLIIATPDDVVNGGLGFNIIVVVDERDGLMSAARANGIPSGGKLGNAVIGTIVTNADGGIDVYAACARNDAVNGTDYGCALGEVCVLANGTRAGYRQGGDECRKMNDTCANLVVLGTDVDDDAICSQPYALEAAVIVTLENCSYTMNLDLGEVAQTLSALLGIPKCAIELAISEVTPDGRRKLLQQQGAEVTLLIRIYAADRAEADRITALLADPNIQALLLGFFNQFAGVASFNMLSVIVSLLSSATGDPHFVTPRGNAFDFNGRAHGSYCIVTDRDLQVNARFVGVASASSKATLTGSDDRTWMDQIAVLHGDDRVLVEAASRPGTPFTAPSGRVVVNGRVLPATNARASTLALASGLTVTRRKTRVLVTIPEVAVIEVEVVRAAFWEVGSGPGRNFLNLKMREFKNTAAAHGVLGQSFPDKLRSAVEGSVDDYVTSGIYSTDCRFNQFEGSQQI